MCNSVLKIVNYYCKLPAYFCALVTLWFIPSLLFCQNVVGEWDGYASTLNIRDLLIREHCVYGASSGGLVQFDIESQKFDVFGIRDGLTRMDIKCIAEDIFGNFWLGMSYPDGEINVWDVESMTVKDVFNESDWGEKLSSISDFTFYKNQAFAAYQQNVDWGILHFKIEGNKYEYKDFYPNFPLYFSSINSVSVFDDTIWIATSSGLLYSELSDTIDLKNPKNWEIVHFLGQNYVSSIVEYNSAITVNFGLDIYKIEGDQPVLINYSLNKKINSLSVDVDGNLIASTNRGVYKLQDERWIPFGGGNILKTVSDIDRNLWGCTPGNGLWNYNGDGYTFFLQNTILDNANTSLFIDDNGNLTTATLNGISFLTDKGWYNIVKSNYDKNIHDHSNDDWSYFVADTLAYQVSSRIYSIVKRSDGNYFASLYGSHIEQGLKGGLLRFNLNDLENYIVYDTTDGVIAGSEGKGGSAYYLCPAYMALDKKDNLWIANQYAQNDSVIAVLSSNDQWYHFSIDESDNFLNYHITSIDFDKEGRVWFASEVHGGDSPSNGGLIVLNYNGTLGDKSDDEWYLINTSYGLGDKSVFSIVFDKEEELWIMNAAGIQRAIISSRFPDKIFDSIDSPALTSIPFAKECRIKVDDMNNKWISTVNSGVKVYTHNGVWLPEDDFYSVEGFTTNNSGLLSNIILDIAFYPPEGLVYLATTKGISVYKSPYAVYGDEYKELKIYPMPFEIPSSKPLVIDGLLQGSEVKITTIDGTFIRHLTIKNGTVVGQQAFWDGKSYHGSYVSSGVYICLAYTREVGKIAVVRK